MEHEIDRGTSAASAVMLLPYRSVVMKKDLRGTARLSIY